MLGNLCPQGVEGVVSVHVADDQFAIDADQDFRTRPHVLTRDRCTLLADHEHSRDLGLMAEGARLDFQRLGSVTDTAS